MSLYNDSICYYNYASPVWTHTASGLELGKNKNRSGIEQSFSKNDYFVEKNTETIPVTYGPHCKGNHLSINNRIVYLSQNSKAVLSKLVIWESESEYIPVDSAEIHFNLCNIDKDQFQEWLNRKFNKNLTLVASEENEEFCYIRVHAGEGLELFKYFAQFINNMEPKDYKSHLSVLAVNWHGNLY